MAGWIEFLSTLQREVRVEEESSTRGVRSGECIWKRGRNRARRREYRFPRSYGRPEVVVQHDPEEFEDPELATRLHTALAQSTVRFESTIRFA